MIDLNQALDNILKKHLLYDYPLLKDSIESYIRIEIEKYVRKYGRKIVLRGLKYKSDGVYPLLELLAEYGDIAAIVDRNPFANEVTLKSGKKVCIFDSNDCIPADIDIYIINSKYYGQIIAHDVNQNASFAVIDLYTELRTHYSLALNKTFDEYYDDEIDYTHIKVQRRFEIFKNNNSEENLRLLIKSCLENKDFVTFYKVYGIAGELACKDEFVSIKHDVDDLILHIKNAIKERNKLPKQDVIMHWIDQVGYDELHNLPWLSDVLGSGIVFEKSYTITPYTRATAKSLFWKDEIGSPTEIRAAMKNSLENSTFYKQICDNGFSFHLRGSLEDDLLSRYRTEKRIQFMTASSVHYWNMINDLIGSEKNIFGIVHCISETHEPWMSPECDLYNGSFQFFGGYVSSDDKIRISAKYLDDVIKFYSDILGENTINIYMSDHGKWEDVSLRRYSETAIHTFLGITNTGISAKVHRAFSYKYLPDLVLWCLHIADKSSGMHFFGDSEMYSETFKSAIKHNLDSSENADEVYSDICTGFRGVVYDNLTYIKLDNGKEICRYLDDNNNPMDSKITDNENFSWLKSFIE